MTTKDEKTEYVFYFKHNLFTKSKIYTLALYLHLEKALPSLDYSTPLTPHKIESLSSSPRTTM